MAKLTDKQIQEKLRDIGRLKWECLRRSDKYIHDCEVWSGRKRSSWKDGEIIIGYPWSKESALFDCGGGSKYSKELSRYQDKHSLEWGGLISKEEDVSALRNMGFNPPVTKRQGSWCPFSSRHEINLPLSPKCKYVPFFVTISPDDYISEPYFSRPQHNDPFLENGTASLIKVNWTAPATYLQYFFAKMIEQKKSYLAGVLRGPISEKDLNKILGAGKHDGLAQGRSGFSFDKIQAYLDVWDLYDPCGGDFIKIAEKVWKKDFKEDPDKDMTVAKRRAEQYYKNANKLIQGGYKTLSHNLGVPP